MELETINKLFLELSQITTATTGKEIELQSQVDALSQQLTSCKAAVVGTIAGTVEGHPTHEGNYLQRLRELVAIEREAKLKTGTHGTRTEGMIREPGGEWKQPPT